MLTERNTGMSSPIVIMNIKKGSSSKKSIACSFLSLLWCCRVWWNPSMCFFVSCLDAYSPCPLFHLVHQWKKFLLCQHISWVLDGALHFHLRYGLVWLSFIFCSRVFVSRLIHCFRSSSKTVGLGWVKKAIADGFGGSLVVHSTECFKTLILSLTSFSREAGVIFECWPFWYVICSFQI